MSLKQLLQQKVPRSSQLEPHFKALLEHIEMKGIDTEEHLVDFLKKEVSIIEKEVTQLKKASSTSVKSVRDRVVHLEMLRKGLGLIRDYL